MVSGQGLVELALEFAFARFKAEKVVACVFNNSVQQPLSALNSPRGLRCFAKLPDRSGEGETGSDEGGWNIDKE